MAEGIAVSSSPSRSSVINESALTASAVQDMHGQPSPKLKIATKAVSLSPKVKRQAVKVADGASSVNGVSDNQTNSLPDSQEPNVSCTEDGCLIVANGIVSHRRTSTPVSEHASSDGGGDGGGGATVRVQVTPVTHSKYAPPPKPSARGHTRAHSAGGGAHGPVRSPSGHRRWGSMSDSSSRSEIGSPGSELSQDRVGASSSSSSLSHDASYFSQDDSIASRNMLVEQLKAEIFAPRTSSDPTLLSSSSHEGSEDGGGAAVAQQKDEVITQLLEHIVDLKMELGRMREESSKLKTMRSNMDDELHTLTENLFEEAYKMVDEAKGSKFVAEKKLADAAGKIDALETEMSCLKSVLHAPPDKHSLQPPRATSGSPHNRHKKSSVRRAIRKISKRTGLPLGRVSPSKHHSAHPLALLEHKHEEKGASLMQGEVDEENFEVFCQWLKALSTNEEHPYLANIVALDVRPCLAFKNKELSEQVLHACEQNTLHMETVAVGAESGAVGGASGSGSVGGASVEATDGPSSANGSNGGECTGVCSLTGDQGISCTHRIKISDSDQWHYISQQCRDRIAAVCDFYMFVGHIQKGIIKSDESKLYWQVMRLRALMSLARLSLRLPDPPTAH